MHIHYGELALTPGTRLDSYEIVAPLGVGGMGEVYRARDRKLDRDVAIKVLPPSVARDPATLARFEREAKAVAALSHPHILAIHDFGSHDGIAYAVMELLEGVTLRAKLDAGPIAQKHSIDYAVQIARGLSAAHGKGIVHRDLKPENLVVSRDGHVKILDFGLAKRVESDAPGEMGPTRSGHTEPGTIMGTAGYMSPEQVKGLPVDHRSDIFAFGVILYELLSGQRAFKGETNAETMAAILRDEPAELSASGRNISPALDRIVRRCLEKDRHHRFQSASDIAFSLVEQSSSGASGGPPPGSAAGDAMSGSVSADEGFGVAVMPFKSIGSRADLEALAAGLTEDIVTGFSRFPYLRVRSAGHERGARYVMEGSLRHAGAKVRLAVQLVDVESGARTWAETYERPFDPDAAFELQDDLVHRIVGTCADTFGVLARSISDAVRGREPGRLGPYEALMRGFGYHHRLTETEHAAARAALERAVDLAPGNADCWAMLSWVTAHEHGHGFNARPGSLDRALAAARRAVDIAPSNPLAQQALGVVSFFRKETTACLSAAERALALNPLDTSNEAMFLIAFSGDWERGCALIRRAMELNPHHPRWYELTLGINEYRLQNYQGAVDAVAQAGAPEIFWSNVLRAASHAQLGELPAARQALHDLLSQRPDFSESAGTLFSTWFDPPMAAHVLEGLRKAGLHDAPGVTAESAAAAPARERAPVSGAVRAEEGFWIAVLPFRYSGAGAELTALAEGLTEDIVTGLARFSYLRVIARGSTARFAGDAADVRTIGRELGARYVMDGSIRQAGTSLRAAAQLVDAGSGAHLWAETYSRPFVREDIFEIQDDVAPRIVSTVADMNGVLPHMMSEALRGRRPEDLSPYEAVLRSFGYLARLNAEEHAEVRDGLERAVAAAPGYADGLAMLSNLYAEEYKHGFNARPDPLGRALDAARRAVAAAPSNHLAFHVLAQALFFRKEFPAFEVAAEGAIALNPMDGCTIAFMGILLAYAGKWERGLALAERAMQLNPRYPGWYRFAAFNNALRTRDYRTALDVALKFNMPSYYHTHSALAAAYGHLGDTGSAAGAVRELLEQKPDFASIAREELAKWIPPALVEEHLEGLRKAGLSIPPAAAGSGAGPPR